LIRLQDEASCLQRRVIRRSDDATQNAAEIFFYFITPSLRFVKDFLSIGRFHRDGERADHQP